MKISLLETTNLEDNSIPDLLLGGKILAYRREYQRDNL